MQHNDVNTIGILYFVVNLSFGWYFNIQKTAPSSIKTQQQAEFGTTTNHQQMTNHNKSTTTEPSWHQCVLISQSRKTKIGPPILDCWPAW